MDLSGLAWYPSWPITSGKLPSPGLQCAPWFMYLCVCHLSAVFTISHHHLYSTEISSASLVSSAHSVTTSTNIKRHSHCPQCQGYQMSILKTVQNIRLPPGNMSYIIQIIQIIQIMQIVQIRNLLVSVLSGRS